jgi:Tol biopolymer transport system component
VFTSNRLATPAQWSEDGGAWALYLIGADGRGLRQLTSPEYCTDDYPTASPNGAEIAFVRDCPWKASDELMVVPSRGGRARSLATTDGALAWSPNGRFLAFSRQFHPTDPEAPDDLWTIRLSSGRLHRVAEVAGAFAWSHDGKKLAYGCGGSLCVRDMRSGAIQRPRRYFSPNDSVPSVAWSADDKQIAFVDGSGGSYDPNYSAWVMSSDGRHVHRLRRYGQGNVDNIQWLPHHRDVLVMNTDEASLYLVDANGRHYRLFPFEVDDVYPAPDGQKLLFVRRVFDSAGNYYRSALSLASLGRAQTKRLTQAGGR